MATEQIDERLSMYKKVRDFANAHRDLLKSKSIYSVVRRLDEHETDLEFLVAIHAQLLLKESADSLEMLNLRLAETHLASQIVHKIVFGHYELQPKDSPDTLLTSMYRTKAGHDRLFYNHVCMFLSTLNRDKESLDIPEELVKQLQEANGQLKLRLDAHPETQTHQDIAAAEILSTVHCMDERLEVLDRLMSNFKSSDGAMFKAYFSARNFARTKHHSLPYFLKKKEQVGRALKD